MATTLDREQLKTVRAFKREARARYEDPRERRRFVNTAIAVGLVEDNLHNSASVRDHDSQNWRQEREQGYGDDWARTGGPLNLRASVRRFANEYDQMADPGERPGQIAPDVQRPAAQYRGRYGEVAGQANAIRKAVTLSGRVPRAGGGRGRGGGGGAAAAPGFDPGSPVDALAAAQQRLPHEALVPGGSLQAPAHSAQAVLPQGYVGLPSGGGPQMRERPSDLTAAAGLSEDFSPPAASGGQSAQGVRPGKTLVIGDSLGVGTAGALERKLGGRITSDVKVGRSSAEGLKHLRAALQKGGDFDRVVFDLGTNDESAGELRRNIVRARRLAGDAPVYVSTVRGPGAKQKNAMLRSLPGVEVVDWARRTGNRPGLVAPDGVHATERGYSSRAQQLVNVVGREEGVVGAREARRQARSRLGMGGFNNAEGLTDDLTAWAGKELGLAGGSRDRSRAENAAAGGAENSDHLEDVGVGKGREAVDLPTTAAQGGWSKYRAVARKLGVTPAASGFTEGTIKVGGRRFRVQIIFGEANEHDDHIHVGFERIG